MNLNITNSYLIILLIFLVTPFLAVSQNDSSKELTQAIQLFDKGNFAEAEPLFKNILDEKPSDFMVNYFYGACRTENNHFTNADLDCLITANKEVSPININYYFGVQYQARSNWERALKFYNKFLSIATVSESEKRNIPEKIQQCYDKINPYEEFMVNENIEEIIPVAVVENTVLEVDSTKNNLTQHDSISVNDSLEVLPDIDSTSSKTEIVTETEKGESINFVISSEITYLFTSSFKTEEGKDFFERGDSI